MYNGKSQLFIAQSIWYRPVPRLKRNGIFGKIVAYIAVFHQNPFLKTYDRNNDHKMDLVWQQSEKSHQFTSDYSLYFYLSLSGYDRDSFSSLLKTSRNFIF